MPTRNRIERAFCYDLGRAIIERGKVSHRKYLSRLRKLEIDYLHELSEFPEDALEVKRRIAERSFEATIHYNCSPSMCRVKFNKISRLGWSNLDCKFHFHWLYARFAAAAGHRRVAEKIVSEMVADLRRSLDHIEKRTNRRGRKWHLDNIALIQRLLEIKTRESR
jgi:hypothetical protein